MDFNDRESENANMGVAKPNQNDLVIMKELLEAGKVKPVLDRCYPLSEVPDAIRYLEEGHAQEKVIITVEQDGKLRSILIGKVCATRKVLS